MSHEHTVIDLSDGLTVLVGPNNCGKSAVVTALQVLCHNDPSTYVLRHGARRCRIRVDTEDGQSVEWSRARNGSPKYLINGQEYDRLNRRVPDQLHEVLRLGKVHSDQGEFDVHFGEQQSPVFLLNDSARAAAEFFASSSDAVRLVEMQSRHQQKVRDARQQHAMLSREASEIDQMLETLQPLDEIVIEIQRCQQTCRELNQELENRVGLESLINRLQRGQQQVRCQQAFETVLSGLGEPPPFHHTELLELVLEQYRQVQLRLESTEAQTHVFQKIQPPPTLVDEEDLDGAIGRLQTTQSQIRHLDVAIATIDDLESPPSMVPVDELHQWLDQISTANEAVVRSERKLTRVDRELTQVRKAIEAWVENHPQCPTCGQRLNAEKLMAEVHQHA